ncbi:unnamed protein product [Caenorhabditis bovis]|uniref:Uncharacterized protein n=1 Tax=Caenorhabditis bovis TaxID=2654633 RepID=A0A8S1EY25_9PELO|nr:unnamed protein product [Caenorhabditis bovis]
MDNALGEVAGGVAVYAVGISPMIHRSWCVVDAFCRSRSLPTCSSSESAANSGVNATERVEPIISTKFPWKLKNSRSDVTCDRKSSLKT